jgi:hypothetical protein
LFGKEALKADLPARWLHRQISFRESLTEDISRRRWRVER